MLRSPGLLASSRHKVPRPELFGFAFVGHDLVIEEAGRQQHAHDRGSTIQGGEDGAYVVIDGDRRRARVATDHSGYKWLFLYRSGRNWALGDSFAAVADFAAECGWPLTPDPTQVRWLTGEGPITVQLSSRRTAAREISFLPATTEVVITWSPWGSRLRLERSTAAGRTMPEGATYRSLLAEFVRTWLSRTATLLASGLPISIDLTGGRDSRTVLATVLAASRASGVKIGPQVRFRSRPELAADFAAATRVAESVGITLNTDIDTIRCPRSGQDAFESWLRLALGVYTPIFFPGARTNLISLGGGGGEATRLFYRRPRLIDQLQFAARHITDREAAGELIAAAMSDVAEQRLGYERDLDERIVHYRHFRDRLHFGHNAQTSVSPAVLASRHLRQAAALSDAEHLERAQVLADLLFNFAPDIATLDYDSPEKAWDNRHLDDITQLSHADLISVTPGAVYAPRIDPGEAQARGASAFEFVGELAERSRRDVTESGLLPERAIADAVELAQQGAEHKTYGRAENARGLSVLLLAYHLLQWSKGKPMIKR